MLKEQMQVIRLATASEQHAIHLREQPRSVPLEPCERRRIEHFPPILCDADQVNGEN